MIREIIQDISYKELQLAVLNGEVDFSELKVFKKRNVSLKEMGLDVRAAIIGTSHYIQFRFEDMILTEMLACDASKEFGGEKLFLEEIPTMNKPFVFCKNDIKYSFEHRISNYRESYDALQNKWEELGSSSPLIHMKCEFNLDTAEPSARTFLSVNNRGNDISIFTAHEYQEENKVVLSNSYLSRLV